MKVDQRQALDTLTKARLLEVAELFELEAPARLRKDEFVEFLARSRRASFEKILGELKRDELKAICQAAGLDDGGRAKAVIADRILGRDSAEAAADEEPAPRPAAPRQLELVPGAAPQEGKAHGRKKRRGRGEKKTNGATLGFEEKLWTAADKLRNNIDAAEYKHVVLGLIFLKYISDAFEEKHAQLEAERHLGADPEDPDEYLADNIFWVPREARWAQHGRHRGDVVG